MNIRQNDIVVRRFQEATTLWVSERYICEVLGERMSDYLWKIGRLNYKKSVPPCHQSKDILPDTGKAWRYARINGQFYYDFDRIPDRKDTQYRSRLGDKDSLLLAADSSVEIGRRAVERSTTDMIQQYVSQRISNNDVTIFRFKKINGTCKYNLDKAHELAEAITWARCIKALVVNGGFKEFGIKTKEAFYEACATILHKKQLEGFMITTGGSLRKKLHYFPADESEQYAFFVTNRFGNDNARKLGKYKLVDEDTGEIKRFDIHEALILKLWMNFGGSAKETKVALWSQYERDIQWLGEKVLSYSTFCHYTNMYDTRLKTYKERHGWKAYASTFLSYIPSESLRYGNSLWCADGSGTLAYSYLDKTGKLRSMRLYIIMVTDVATGKIVGWAPAIKGQHKETPEMVKQAVLMGLEGCGRREIMEFVSDNHGAFTGGESVEFLTQVCRKVRTIEAHNSQANYAETQFRLFKKTIRNEFNWLGSSWGSTDIENTANEDYLNKETFPSYEEVIGQIARKIDDWNNQVTRTGESRTELYAESIHPEANEIDSRVWRHVAGNYTKQEITRQRGNIVIEKAGQKYMFEIPDVASISEVIRNYLGYAATVEAHMYWDEEECDLYTMDGRFMFTCFAARKAVKSHAEETEETAHNLGHHVWRQAAQKEAVLQYENEAREVADWLDEQLPYGVAAKLNGGKNAKEVTNEQKERALEIKANRKKEVVPSSSQDEDEYMQMRKKLYKNN
ncbi:hypothetical protein [Parabacteroides chinchillae]|uniref:Integrase catalytic domain-containing protein n=1 Tax=Parabacteroides chinchillae TaxID=871327 RepID=A0A8G2FAU5_9BACT|nr:hypothetical protein [Parabacteroides chinchillae]SEF86902.1 hypothetical protein SAMN05444001_108138 [Parabacteroides chinchillae]